MDHGCVELAGVDAIAAVSPYWFLREGVF